MNADDQPAPGLATDRFRLERMFVDHHQVVWRTLRRCGLDPETAADAAQQAFLVSTERLGDIRPGSERAFLIGTALRLARSAWRKTRRWALQADMDLHSAGPLGIGKGDGADLQLIDLALSKLDPSLVEVFVLFELEEFSSPEIARALDLPVGTVASRLRRARDEFRAVARRIETTAHREEGTS